MFRLNYAPIVCYSPDETGGGTAVVEPPEVDSAPDATPASPDHEPGDKPDAQPDAKVEPETDYKALLAETTAKYESRITAMGKTMQRMQETQGADAKKADTKPDTKADTKPDTSTDINEHPLLKGLPKDQYGDVEINGQSVSPEFAIRFLEQERRSQENERALRERDDAQRQAAYDKERDEAIANFAGIVTDLADVVLPGLDGDASKDLAEELEEAAVIAYSRLQHSIKGMSETDANAAITAEATRIVERKRRTYQALITKQSLSNKKYAEEHPLKPDGQAGHPAPADERTLTVAQRRALQTKRSRMAEAQAAANH